MTTSDRPWTLKPDCLERALDRWGQRDNPHETTRRVVTDGLLDILLDPLTWGREEKDKPGVFFGRVAGANVGISYVPNLEDRTVCIAIIDSG